jgi:hypothetical protein
MAFVAVVPAIGTGLAGVAGLGGSALAGLGGLASSIPVIGGMAAPALTGLGGAVGSLGAGLGGSLMGGGMTALTGGLGGAANALLGSAGVGGGLGSGLLGMGSGLGGMYAGADKLLGGFLPNLGVGGTVAPAQGFLSSVFPGMKNMPMFGGQANPFDTYGVKNFDPNNPFDVAQAQGLTQPTETGGMMGGLSGIVGKGMEMKTLLDGMKKDVPPSPASQQHINNLRAPSPQAAAPQILSNPSGAKRTGIYGNMGASPAIASGGGIYQETEVPTTGAAYRQFGATPAPYYPQSGADRVLERA